MHVVPCSLPPHYTVLEMLLVYQHCQHLHKQYTRMCPQQYQVIAYCHINVESLHIVSKFIAVVIVIFTHLTDCNGHVTPATIL